MRKVDVVVADLMEAFAVCRERNRPLVVELEAPDHVTGVPEDATQFKVYPSGRLLWAYDGDNPFQTVGGA